MRHAGGPAFPSGAAAAKRAACRVERPRRGLYTAPVPPSHASAHTRAHTRSESVLARKYGERVEGSARNTRKVHGGRTVGAGTVGAGSSHPSNEELERETLDASTPDACVYSPADTAPARFEVWGLGARVKGLGFRV